jgi:phage shock protein PspC (stress-responsive transcriptional regulator)
MLGWDGYRFGRGSNDPSEESMSMWQNLKGATKSSNDRWIGGVCGGLGAATPIPSWMWRVVFLFSLLAFGVGLLLYIVLWICMPKG